MHKGMKKKLKVYAVDAAMIFLAFQLTTVIKGGKTEGVEIPPQKVIFEEREEIRIPEEGKYRVFIHSGKSRFLQETDGRNEKDA